MTKQEKNKAYQKAYYEKNRERVLARMRRVHAAKAPGEHAARLKRARLEHPDRERETQARYYAKNKHKRAAYRQANQDRRAEYQSRYYAENREYLAAQNKEWQQKNKDAVLAYLHRRRTRLQAGGGSYTPLDISWLLIEQSCLCRGCACDIETTYTVDHIVPVSRGGSSDPENLQLLCKPCNSSKKNRTMDEWLFVAPRTRLCPWPRKK